MNFLDKFQAIIRGINYRKNNLPNSILFLKKYLHVENLNNQNKDGRVNSLLDESIIIKKINKLFIKHRIFIPKDRHWFDIAIKDYRYGWLPINIKTTTMNTSDNTSNLAMLVYALTNYNLELNKCYKNGIMSKILVQEIKKKNYNKKYKKDYYFLVINKLNSNEIIVNSVNGLTELTQNINNLPFQIKWKNNKNFKYKKIEESWKDIINIIKKPKPSWKENFLNEMRNID